VSQLFVIAVIIVGWLLYKKHFKPLMAQGKAGQMKLILIGLGLLLLI
jgi:uncharacterized membrane protein YwzB